MNTFGRDIYNGTITLKGADKNQSDLLVELINFKSKIKPKTFREKAKEKRCSSNFIFTF